MGVNIDQLFIYLKEKVPNFNKTSKRGKILFTCPQEDKHHFKSNSPTMTVIPGSDKFYCLSCAWKGNTYDLVRLVENKQMTDEEVVAFMTNNTRMDIYPELDEYKKYGWAIIPIAKNGKVPLEKEWTSKTHYEKSDWVNWLEQGLNIGVRTGETSGITVIDADLKVAPSSESAGGYEELYRMLTGAKTLTQNSPHGKHFIFKYDKEIKQTVKIANITIDIRNDGGQILICPSKINHLSYNWVNLGAEIKEIPPEFKSKLLEINKVEMGRKSEISPEIFQEMKTLIDNPIELIGNNLEGQCNNKFTQFGGALLKIGIPPDKVKVILYYLNKNWLKNPMPSNAVDAMVGSLEGYKETEEHTQENAIYECCKLLSSDISAKDIMEHVFPGERNKRAIVDKYLAKLFKEGKLSRKGRGKYELKQKVEWTNEKQECAREIKYKIPYFDDVAYFRNGDIILIGAPTGHGKTTIAINFIKQMKEQGIKPYYLSLEAGSRHEKTAEAMGLTQLDYYIPKETVVNPLAIEIEPNSFTILDWLYTGDDFAQTQAVFKHLNDEMVRKGGILIVFTQLKEDYNWFAVNLVKSFPRFATRFVYDDDIGIISHFDVCKITDPKGHNQNATVSTEFNFETKELKKKNNL
jgi:hypothetical protein